MKVYCPFCSAEIEKSSIDNKLFEKEEHVTSAHIRCKCRATGFLSFMKIDNNSSVITLQMKGISN